MKPLTPLQKEALRRALCNMQGARSRWAERQRLSDDELTRAIAFEFGIRGGMASGDMRFEYAGGIRPWVEITCPDGGTLRLEGKSLLAAVRETMGAGYPGELF